MMVRSWKAALEPHRHLRRLRRRRFGRKPPSLMIPVKRTIAHLPAESRHDLQGIGSQLLPTWR